MYRYDEFDQIFVDERVAQFRGQVARRLAGDITEDAFKPLRLMNGLYLQLHAYMLRVAVPYGVLSSRQLRQLAKVEMHAIQTSGNCIRNTTADPFAGVAADEIEDPRVHAEIIRQWSTLHPEFSFLPRKFKIAVTGAPNDRAAIKTHDIGIAIVRNDAGETGFEIFVGGGQGRTPVVARRIRDFLPKQHLLSYLEAILRVYNQLGQRANIYKARIKILVNTVGIAEFTRLVEAEWRFIKETAVDLPAEEVARIEAYFAAPAYDTLPHDDPAYEEKRLTDPAFARWARTSVFPHKRPGYAIVTISLKPVGGIPGDATAEQMEAVADLADRYSFGELRVTHEQNLVLADVRQRDLHALWQALQAQGLATANVGLLTDIIACPGLDYCNLANARSIPIAQRISERFADLNRVHEIGRITLNISGCINACGHHHVGNIGILGVDKKGTEFYQVTLGGSADENTEVGKIVGPAFDEHQIVDAIETIVNTYLAIRKHGERFIDTYRRVGVAPFKESLYAPH